MEFTAAGEKSFRESQSIECGIDLGTTNSLCAWVYRLDPNAQPPISFQFADHRPNHPVFPSVVGVEAGSDRILVGLDAVDNELKNPTGTLRSIKRLMGRRFDDKEVQRLRRRAAYEIARDEAGMVMVRLGGRLYSPIDISAMILSRIRSDAEAHFGKPVTHAVIAVPAYFDDSQKNATREAARRAGLVVKRIVTEPVAASYAYGYGISRTQKPCKLLVFDMGGGTLDVSVIRAAYPLGHVMDHQGDMWLGGDDEDEQLVNRKSIEIGKRFACSPGVAPWRVDPARDPAFMIQLRNEVRRAKEVICASDQTQVELNLPLPIQPPVGEPVPVRGVLVTRQEVLDTSRELSALANGLIEKALKGAHLSVREVDRVLLVGGSSYLLGVEEAVRRVFTEDQIASRQDPIASVALGCAILARMLVGVDCLCGHVNDKNAVTCRKCNAPLEYLLDATNLPYGIEVRGGGFEQVLPKGSRYGVVGERTFYTSKPGQTRIYIPVYQGESARAEKNSLQGFVALQIAAPKPAGTPIQVRMSANENGILEVQADCDSFQVQTTLKPGDWSTSLKSELRNARGFNGRSDVVEEGERILNAWHSSGGDPGREQEIIRDGRQLLGRLQERAWEWLLDVPAGLLMRVLGEGSKRLPYVDALGDWTAGRIREAAADYRAGMETGPTADRYRVERAIWRGIQILLDDDAGECILIMLLRAIPDSPEAVFRDLALDLERLDVLLIRRQDAKAAGKQSEADILREEARAHVAAVMGRDYYRQARDIFREARRDDDLPSSGPSADAGRITRTMKRQG